MSQPDITSFLSSMVEAKRALDAEPVYQARIRELEQKLTLDGHTIAAREQRIHELKQAEDSLVQKLRSVEAERDDAAFHALEEAEKVSAMSRLLRGFIDEAVKVSAVVEGVEPPSLITAEQRAKEQAQVTELTAKSRGFELEAGGLKEHVKMLENEVYSLKAINEKLTEQKSPLPAVESTPSPESTVSSIGETKSSQGNADWKPAERDWSGGESDYWGTPKPLAISPDMPEAKGQSAVDPTTAPTPISEPTQTSSAGTATSVESTSTEEAKADAFDPFASMDIPSQPVSFTGASSTEDAASAASKERNRDRSTFFKNRKYYDVTYFVPISQWLAEGGTIEDYHWKPEKPSQI